MVLECGLAVFARIFDATLCRFRSKIAQFCIRFGAILAREMRAWTAKPVQSSLADIACLEE